MDSLRGQILARMVQALKDANIVDGSIYRNRVRAFDREEVPAINVLFETEDTEVLGNSNTDENLLSIAVDIRVRGEPWDQLAESIAIDANRVLMLDPELKLLLTRIRRTSTLWRAEEADQTAGLVTMKYRIRHVTAMEDLTKKR